ncbi:hypothetical protein [Pediococcus damnosus]|uniref:Uncharacterized protein n=2 Tax=Pediococcus damnosus TaxID=51663 RepID=A0AAC9FIX7_9LACO|nr:hypothetical protein [Pediococcus damnosus]AMV60349.1 Hypothetical protein ADU69_0680 [Pediococcus damnosus]AMV62883.1 Hypothetical protein ADU70_1399 [Pediococcus damnosus]AMV64599.1 Hypothetical protein ADU71_0685 [Pediococcus damnosus]AMV69537.1 Hypothetical protein ADU73_1137 [Pediococcus damnosus]GEA92445.1 hypothetical protein PDA01_03380 [Pediococcus damnosus]
MSSKMYQRMIAAAILIIVIGISRPFPMQWANTLCLILGAALIVLTIIIGQHKSNQEHV